MAVKCFKTLAVFSLFVLLAAACYFLLPEIPYPTRAAIAWEYDQLWRDSLNKQISGYILLGCSVVVLMLSLRKRISRFSKGDFSYWRIMHVVIGCFTIAVLLAHTGLRLGENLNYYLMICFTGLLLVGGMAGLVIALEHRMNPGMARTLRSRFLWLHIILFWPLPALLGFHILKSYYF